MLDFRIMVGVIVVCVSLVVIGVRLLVTSDTLNVALGERPGLRTAAAPRQPVAPRRADEPPLIPPVALPRTTASSRRTAAPARPQAAKIENPEPAPPAAIAAARPDDGDITGSLGSTGDAEAEPAEPPAPRRRTAARRKAPDSELSPLLMFFYRNSIAK